MVGSCTVMILIIVDFASNNCPLLAFLGRVISKVVVVPCRVHMVVGERAALQLT